MIKLPLLPTDGSLLFDHEDCFPWKWKIRSLQSHQDPVILLLLPVDQTRCDAFLTGDFWTRQQRCSLLLPEGSGGKDEGRCTSANIVDNSNYDLKHVLNLIAIAEAVVAWHSYNPLVFADVVTTGVAAAVWD